MDVWQTHLAIKERKCWGAEILCKRFTLTRADAWILSGFLREIVLHMWTNWPFQTIQLSSFYQRSKNVKPDWCSSQVSHVILHMLEHIWRNGMLLYHFCSITHKHKYFWMHRNTCMTFHIYQHLQYSIKHNVYSTVSHNTMHSTWLFLFSVINHIILDTIECIQPWVIILSDRQRQILLFKLGSVPFISCVWIKCFMLKKSAFILIRNTAKMYIY